MDSEIEKWTLEGELSDPCLDGNPQIWHHFSQCVRRPSQLVGFVFGCLAIGFWLVSHLGVLRKRHREGTVVDKLPEAHHMLHEAGADVLHCIGAVLSHQLGTQILFGVYLLCMDALFMVQYLVFKAIKECTSRGYTRDTKEEREMKLRHRVSLKVHTWPLLLLLLTTSIGGFGIVPLITMHLFEQSQTTRLHSGGRVLLGIDQKNVFQDRCMSWQTMAFTTLGIIGNLSYVISVFCHYTDFGFLVHTLPWTLGRLGLIGIDTGLVMLSLVNYCRDPHLHSDETEEAERLLDDVSEEESASDTSDWETPNDLKRNKKILQKKANNRLSPRYHSDTDVSPHPSPSVNSKSRQRRRASFQTPTLTTPSAADPHSDVSAEAEWRPAWTEEDVKVELTEEQVFAVLAEEDRKREQLSGPGESDSQTENAGTDNHRPALEVPTKSVRPEANGSVPNIPLPPQGADSNSPQQTSSGNEGHEGQQNGLSWLDESQQSMMLDMSGEDVVDMQQDSSSSNTLQ